MAPQNTAANGVPTEDDLDALFNLDDDGEEFGTSANTGTTTQQAGNRQNTTSASAGLGIDDEIKITKKRQPIPKLDADRLLSPAGVPKLRRISKEHLKFKGKGHEYSDVARLLNMYQFWLDDLYPRAKFGDALAILEKLGHTKRMQIMRKEWIEEGKPKLGESDPEDDLFGPEETNQHSAGNEDARPMDEEQQRDDQDADALEDPRATSTPQEQAEDMAPDEDELDALLAEEPPDRQSNGRGSISTTASKPAKPTRLEEDEFADEMEAMAGMEDMW